MGTPRQRFREALEATIWHNAMHEKEYLYRRDVEEIGRSVGLPEAEACEQFLNLAGEVWVGHIRSAEAPEIPVYSPPQEIPPDWIGVRFDVPWMQHKGKSPSGGPLD